jgi:type 1 glutamine amidotransferase
MHRLEHRRALARNTFMALCLAACGAREAASQSTFKVFMIASKASDHIVMSTEAKIQVEKLGLANGFTVDYTTDPSLITEANLAKYQVFLQMHFAPFEMNVAQRAVFQKFIDEGKGWVGVHAAGLTGDQFGNGTWPWYTAFFGGVTYVTHPALQTGTILFEDRAHPITKNLPASFQLKDEWYEWNKNPRPNVHVLGKADETTYNQVKSQGDHPIVWTNQTYPKMVYVGIGHDVSDWTNANYILLIREALLWAKPASTRMDPRDAAKGYLGAPVAKGGTWMRGGVIKMDAPGGRGGAGENIMLNAAGRRLIAAPAADLP